MMVLQHKSNIQASKKKLKVTVLSRKISHNSFVFKYQ